MALSLLNKKFGFLKVISKNLSTKKWRCECPFGHISEFSSEQLLGGKTKCPLCVKFV